MKTAIIYVVIYLFISQPTIVALAEYKFLNFLTENFVMMRQAHAAVYFRASY